MKIAITGEKGFLGYHLTQHYLNKGVTVVSLGRNYLNNIHLVEGCDYIIHAAGVNRASVDEDVYRLNVELAQDLVSKLQELNLKIPIKFISSIQEGNETSYGRGKRKAKEILLDYCSISGVILTTYELLNLFGTHGKPNYNSFVNTFAYNIIHGKECKYNTNLIKLCWVEDIAKVISGETSLLNSIDTSVQEVYEILLEIHNNISTNTSQLAIRLKQIYNYYKITKMKVLVLGHTGLLGSMVSSYLKSKDMEVINIEHRWPTLEFQQSIKDFNGDFIINCIGAIPQRTKSFEINTNLPIWLSDNAECKVIHPGTDCEMDYDEYGLSKKAASTYIKQNSTNTKILQTSIIGPEPNSKFGLMAWFLSQTGEISGYTEAIWNGNTTLEWAKQAESLIWNWSSYRNLTILEGEPISKFDLLSLIKEVYNKNININPINLGKNKCLKGDIKTKSLREQLEELKKFSTL